MKTFLADTNIFLRYFLRDNISQAKQSAQYLKEAKKGNIGIIILPQIIFEVEFAMRKIYKVQRDTIAAKLLSVVRYPYLKVENREMLVKILHIYRETNLHIVDCFLVYEASMRNVEIFTFDKQLKKLSTSLSS